MGRSRGASARARATARPPSEPRSRRTLALALLLAAITVAVFGQVAGFEFLTYDDPIYVSDNPRVRSGLTADGVRWAFGIHESNWHPLTWLSLMLDAEIAGDDPAAFHVTNLVLHVANTLLLFGVLFRMTAARLRSGFVALLFAIHPLHVESVAWVAERKDVLSTLFWFAALAAYAAYAARPTAARYAGVLLAFVLGLMSKPMVVTLPIVLLLLDLWPLRRFADDRGGAWARLPRLVVEKIPFFLLSAASSVVTLAAQRAGGALGDLEAFPLAVRAGNAVVSYVLYLGQTLWPAGLSVFYPHPGHSLDGGTVVAAAALLLGATAAALGQLRRRPWIAMGWLWYLLTLVPVIGLVQVGLQGRADRYTYVPLVGLFIVAVWGAAELADAAAERARAFRVVAVIVPAGIAAALAAASFVQTGYWRDSVTLYRHALSIRDDNAGAHNNLARALLDRGDLEGAVWHAREALRLAPEHPEPPVALGNALARQGRLDEAIAVYREALARRPERAILHSNLGIFLTDAGRVEQGGRHLRQAVRLDPGAAYARYNLGVALARQGRYDEAIVEFEESLRLDPFDGDCRQSLELARRLRGR